MRKIIGQDRSGKMPSKHALKLELTTKPRVQAAIFEASRKAAVKACNVDLEQQRRKQDTERPVKKAPKQPVVEYLEEVAV